MRIDSELRDAKSNDCWNVIYYMLLSASTHIYQCGDPGEQLKGGMKNVDENIDDSTMRTTSNDLGVLHATQSTNVHFHCIMARVPFRPKSLLVALIDALIYVFHATFDRWPGRWAESATF
jgi:hypothetical protein